MNDLKCASWQTQREPGLGGEGNGAVRGEGTDEGRAEERLARDGLRGSREEGLRGLRKG